MKWWITIYLLFLSTHSMGQYQQPIGEEPQNENSLEDLSESDDTEPEDDYDTQQLLLFRRHPLNINGPAERLRDFPLLNGLLVENLVRYRNLMGDLISPYELQAVPGFNADVIRQIFPYITIHNAPNLSVFPQLLRSGRSTLIIRPTLTLEKIQGYSDSASPASAFLGGKPSLFVRYKYQHGHSLQYGFTAEKDAGELIRTDKFPWLMDFHSFHLFVRKPGKLKTLAIGDYTINMGQGLIHWQSQAFKKSAGVLNVKRQGAIIRPYQSSGEFNFFRGIAMTAGGKRFEYTVFASCRKLSANTDVDGQDRKVITSWLTSGLYRSSSEKENKNRITSNVFGTRVAWSFASGHISYNHIRHRFSLPILKRNEPYNLFAIKGDAWSNQSIDYSFTIANMHFFGEAATDHRGKSGFISGMMASLHSRMDVSIVYRNISPAYQTIFGNAFTENTLPGNEDGIYIGVSYRPAYRWTIDAYTDYFSFPWLKYRVDAPSNGYQYLAQVTWKPSKAIDIYTRLRQRVKPLNLDSDPDLHQISDRSSFHWRTHLNCRISQNILIRWRLETTVFRNRNTSEPESGFLLYADMIYKPLRRPFSLSTRLQHFETDSYDTRLYAYENDLYLTAAVPAFSGKGFRYYLNFHSKHRIKALRNMELSFSVKISRTYYPDEQSIGSGATTIHGNRKTDVRCQLFFSPAS